MCGRFTLAASAATISKYFDIINEIPEMDPRYNIAPTQAVFIIRHNENLQREIYLVRWGLVPSWMKKENISSKMINARAETVSTQPAYRTAYRKRRCLVIADGFYEWQRQSNANKQPYYIFMKRHPLFAMLGLWEHWEGEDQEVIESCTIITTAANSLVEKIHHRMPAIISTQHYDQWLSKETQPDVLKQLLKPYPAAKMESYPVSLTVNKPSVDIHQCIEKL